MFCRNVRIEIAFVNVNVKRNCYWGCVGRKHVVPGSPGARATPFLSTSRTSTETLRGSLRLHERTHHRSGGSSSSGGGGWWFFPSEASFLYLVQRRMKCERNKSFIKYYELCGYNIIMLLCFLNRMVYFHRYRFSLRSPAFPLTFPDLCGLFNHKKCQN